MDLLFFVMFNIYFKDGKYQNDKPAFTVFCQFVASVFGLQIGLLSLFFWYLKGSCYKYIFNINHIIIFLPISFILIYFLFYFNKRYLRIYEKYRLKAFANNLFAKIVAIIIMIIMLLFGVIVAYFKRKYDLCPSDLEVPFSIFFPNK